MNDMHLSKSSYCKGVQCEKILWLARYRPDILQTEKNEGILEKGRQVGDLAKGLFGDFKEVPADEDLSLRIEKTEMLLQQKPNVIAEASFSFNGNFCSVDVLKNDADGVEIYEVKGSTKVKEVYVDDAAYQCFVLSNLGLNVKRVCIVYLNRKYVRGKELDMEELFNIEDITSIAFERQSEIRNNIAFIKGFMQSHADGEEPVKEIGMHCFDPYSCDYWDYCTRDLERPNVFDVRGMYKSDKFEKYNDGKISFEDLACEDINPKFLEQIDFELNARPPKINTDAICDVLDSLKYPLYFIDYEACQYAIPELEGTKPFQQIPFQYSLHIIRQKGAPLEHKEFLADIDDENIVRTFAESMIGDLSEDGSVIVYNRTFEESLVNKKIAEMYPDLRPEIERINSNIVDFMKPFKDRNYYTREMEGSYSIKHVLPALCPELDYGDLPLVHNGFEASEAFMSMKHKSLEEREEIREGLLRYCELDTYAMVRIWEVFNQAVKRD